MDRRRLILAAVASLAALTAPALALANEGGKEEAKTGSGSSFLPLQTLTATVNRMGGRRGVMTVDVGLDIPNKSLRERAQMSTPRLRAAYIQTLAIYAAGLPAARAPNADFIAMQLQNQTDTMLGQAGAKLLVGSILIN
jgi:hypothetical protein